MVRSCDLDVSERLELQDQQYAFPYHYIPYFDDDGYAFRYRSLNRGLEYLCYVKHVVEAVVVLDPDSLLDVGCGDGRVIGELPGIKRRVGVDRSERAIRFAAAFHRDIEFHVGTAEDLSGEFDVVIAVEVLEHVPDEDVSSFLRALHDRTRSGGHVILTVPSTNKPPIEKHFRHYDSDTFMSQLDRSDTDLEVCRVQYVYRETRLIRWYRRLTENRFWHLEFHGIRRWIWKYVWNSLRCASQSNGSHIVFTLSRP